MERGIVIGFKFTLNEEGVIKSLSGKVENADLVKWLLYWDKIVFAGVGRGGALMTGGATDDTKFLEAAGVFSTRVIDVTSLDFGALPPAREGGMSVFGLPENHSLIAFSAATVKAAESLATETKQIWTVGQSGGEQLILPGRIERELIDVQLINCLPVPSGETPFVEILEFKAAHQAELERLRFALDALREKILSSADEQRATLAAISELSTSLADVHKAMRGSGIHTVVDSVGLYTTNPSLGFWTALGGAAASLNGIPVEFGALAGIAVPTAFRFLKRNLNAPEVLPGNNSDFAYAFEAVRRLR